MEVCNGQGLQCKKKTQTKRTSNLSYNDDVNTMFLAET